MDIAGRFGTARGRRVHPLFTRPPNVVTKLTESHNRVEDVSNETGRKFWKFSKSFSGILRPTDHLNVGSRP
jgi:hypothetical protein